MDAQGFVHLTDYGIAKNENKDLSNQTSGTPGYMSPEVLCAQNHSFVADFFALGVIVYEFLLGRVFL